MATSTQPVVHAEICFCRWASKSSFEPLTVEVSVPGQAVFCLQADPRSVRAATRAATCFLKMGEPDKAAKMLEAVAQTNPLPDELVSKQRDVEQTKQLIAQVCLHENMGCWDRTVQTLLTA